MIKVTGYKELDQMLKGLPAQFSHKIVGSAHFKAAKPLVEKEKLLAPEGPTGNLVDSIGAERVAIGSATNLGEVNVGPRRRKGRYKGYAAHLVEFGTKQRKTSNNANRGSMKAKPFVRPAFDSEAQGVIDSIDNELGQSITRYIKSHTKR